MQPIARCVFTLGPLVLAGCDPSPPDVVVDEKPAVTAFDLPNAMGMGGHDLLPWPADQYLDRATDADHPTVRVDDAQMPAGIPAFMLEADGFTRIPPMVAWLPGGIDPASLPPVDDWGATLAQDSPIRVVVLQGDAAPVPWPVMAEPDITHPDPSDASIILRPHRPFPFGSTVVVGLRTTLTTLAGTPHPPSDALARVLDNDPQDRAEQAWRGTSADALRTALPAIGPTADDLAMAWSFTVRSEAGVIGPSVAMQDAMGATDAITHTLEAVTYEADRALVYGTITTPWWLDDQNRLVLEADGTLPTPSTKASPFLITIPRTVTAQRPTVLFGHGFFSAIEESTWGNLFQGLERWQMPAVTTKFHGFAEEDLVTIAAPAIGGDDITDLAGVIDLQRQSQANFTALHRVITEHLATELTIDWPDDDGDTDDEGAFHPLSATDVPYMGISNGGTQGLVMMATSPTLSRGALVVPGGGWAHMLQRAAQWDTLGPVFYTRFSTTTETQVAMSMLQQIFDPVDSLNYLDHLHADRLPGRAPSPELLLVEAVNDSQVANLVTRWIVGSGEIPVLTPNVADVWDAPTQDVSSDPDAGPIGFESYDLGVPDNPSGNKAPAENGVHNDVRLLDAYREQMGIFLEEGRVVRTCDGACDPE